MWIWMGFRKIVKDSEAGEGFQRRWRKGKPGALQPMGLQRVGHNLVTEWQQHNDISTLHDGVMQSIFGALKVLCALPVHPHQMLAATIVLSCPECYYSFRFLVQLSLKCHRCSIIVIHVCYASNHIHDSLYFEHVWLPWTNTLKILRRYATWDIPLETTL